MIISGVLILHCGEENRSGSNMCVTENEEIDSLRVGRTETPPFCTATGRERIMLEEKRWKSATAVGISSQLMKLESAKKQPPRKWNCNLQSHGESRLRCGRMYSPFLCLYSFNDCDYLCTVHWYPKSPIAEVCKP